MTDARLVRVSVAPPLGTEWEVEYYSTVQRTIVVTNDSTSRVLLEQVTLRFQSDSAETALRVEDSCACELAPSEVVERRIPVTPTPLYLSATNQFDVKVRYRSLEGGRVGEAIDVVFSQSSCVIIREPRDKVGRVFISLKQPEDLDLGRLLRRMAGRAGMEGFLKAEQRRPGDDIWSATIEPALSSSDAIVVIWTENTNWDAKGVHREIEFSRANGIPELLLLERSCTVPPLFKGTSIEYSRFDVDNPGREFDRAVGTLRNRLRKGAP